MTFLLDHPGILSLIVFGLLVLVVEAGFKIGHAYALETQEVLREQAKEARDGIVLLLSFLLGFTLAMALPRYDRRKEFLRDEANDIGTTALRAHLLPEPYASRAVQLVTDYADTRLAYFQSRNETHRTDAALARTKQLQNQLWEVTQEVSRAAPTPITASFIQSLNDTIDISEKQIATLENRIPLTVWLMILIIAALACLASGLTIRRRFFLSMILTPLMAAVVIGLTADLDSPQSGLIRVTLGSMERLHADLHR
jgi:hypothetical protein